MGESETARIIDELRRAHAGDPWHGSPVMAIVADVAPDEAAARPLDGVHTIWELVLHMTAWRNEVRRRLAGAPAAEPLEGDWPAPPPPDPDAWRQALDRLENAHHELVAAAGRLEENALFGPISDPREHGTGRGVSHYVLLHGIVQHDAYHAGQIAILKKTLRQRREHP